MSASQQLEKEIELLAGFIGKERNELKLLERDIEASKSKTMRAKFLSRNVSKRVDMKWHEPICVLVFVCNRVEATREHLLKLIK